MKPVTDQQLEEIVSQINSILAAFDERLKAVENSKPNRSTAAGKGSNNE